MVSSSKKRPRPVDFEDLEEEEKEMFEPSLTERFNEVMTAKHNDREKDPITKKRAPINNEIIEELE